ncbi:MAG: Crp/Fnr family transcriptional regulator [Bacteroidales bacterium]|nr:Crp/Fnr family transcriptional regulator [Bacteroidales bacterium]
MKEFKCTNCKVKSTATRFLTDDQIIELGSNCVEVHFDPGEIIFKQNALSSNIIYLKSGLVKLFMKGPSKDQILKIVRAPAYLGIPTTVGDKVNHYSAMAINNAAACFIDLETFRNMIFSNGSFALEIILTLCKYELQQFHRCINLTQKQLNGKLAGTLLDLSGNIYNSLSFRLDLSRNDLAEMLGTSRESISRLLNEFAEEEIIKLSGKEITILDEKRLKRISQIG